MKKLLAITLAALLALCLVACSKDKDNSDPKKDDEEQQENRIDSATYDLIFDYNEDAGIYEITGIVHDGKTPLDVEIPAMVDNLPIKGIGDEAFKACKMLRSVTIPDSITYIGQAAFYDCDALTTVSLPASVTTVRLLAFGDCDSLQSITAAEGLTAIEDFAFRNCTALTSIKLPQSLTSIGSAAFYHCSSLVSVTLPNSLQSLGDMAFASCTNLTSVTAFGNPTDIGKFGEFVFANAADGFKLNVSSGSAWISYAEANDYLCDVIDLSDPSISDW